MLIWKPGIFSGNFARLSLFLLYASAHSLFDPLGFLCWLSFLMYLNLVTGFQIAFLCHSLDRWEVHGSDLEWLTNPDVCICSNFEALSASGGMEKIRYWCTEQICELCSMAEQSLVLKFKPLAFIEPSRYPTNDLCLTFGLRSIFKFCCIIWMDGFVLFRRLHTNANIPFVKGKVYISDTKIISSSFLELM